MKTKNLIEIFGLLVCILVLIHIFSNTEDQNIEKSVPVKLQQPEFFLEEAPNDSLIYQACIYYNIHNPEVVVAQSILETGYYRSEVCKRDNNLFGLYNSYKKEYFKFSHWSESVKAYKDMIQYKYKEDENYYYFLDRIGYAEDSLYNIKLKKIIEKYDLHKTYKKK